LIAVINVMMLKRKYVVHFYAWFIKDDHLDNVSVDRRRKVLLRDYNHITEVVVIYTINLKWSITIKM
jgi:hypothetical protein